MYNFIFRVYKKIPGGFCIIMVKQYDMCKSFATFAPWFYILMLKHR
jgi:hypothetical protein